MWKASCLKSTTVGSDLESSSVLTLSSFPDVGCWIRSQRSQRDQCGGRQVIKKVWIKPSALLLGNRNDESLQSQNASCGTPGSRATVRDWATTNICYAQVKFLKKKKKNEKNNSAQKQSAGTAHNNKTSQYWENMKANAVRSKCVCVCQMQMMYSTLSSEVFFLFFVQTNSIFRAQWKNVNEPILTI